MLGNINTFSFKKQCHNNFNQEHGSQYKSYQNPEQLKPSWKVETDVQTGLSYFTPSDSSIIVDSSKLSRKHSLVSVNFFPLKILKNRKMLQLCCCVPNCVKSDNDIYLVCQQYTSFPPFQSGESMLLKSCNLSK